jgi:hypothetical protein
MIVGLVGVDLLGAAAPLARRGAHRRQVVQQRREHQAVVGGGPGHQQRQRQPAAVNRQVQLGPALGPVDRVCANVVPRTARRLKESTLTRDQSSAPAWPSSSSSSSSSRSNTPTWAHSANRRQQVLTEPQPNSPTGSSAHGWRSSHEHDRGDVGPIRYGAGRAAAGSGGRRWQQRRDALPQRIGQQAIGQGAHTWDHSNPACPLLATGDPGAGMARHHQAVHATARIAAWATTTGSSTATSAPACRCPACVAPA